MKKTPKELKPAVGRAFNELRQVAKCMEAEELTKEVHLLESLDYMHEQPQRIPIGYDRAGNVGMSGEVVARSTQLDNTSGLPHHREP